MCRTSLECSMRVQWEASYPPGLRQALLCECEVLRGGDEATVDRVGRQAELFQRHSPQQRMGGRVVDHADRGAGPAVQPHGIDRDPSLGRVDPGQICGIGGFGLYPLTPPMRSPRTKCRWTKRVIASTGIVMRVAEA